MNRSWWLKFVFLVAATVFSVAYVFPTVKNMDVAESNYPFKQKINLGLDLQGGVYMVLGVDFSKVYGEVIERTAESLKDNFVQKKVPCSKIQINKADANGKPSLDPRFTLNCDTEEALAELKKAIKKEDTLRITGEKTDKAAKVFFYEVGLSSFYRDTVKEKTISQSIEVIRNRIDEFGVAEPIIRSQGQDRLSVELPGIKDVERAKELIGRTAKLEFKIVADDKKSPDEIAALVSEIEVQHNLKYKDGEKFSEYVTKVNEFAKGKIPAGTEIAFEKEGGLRSSGASGKIPYLLNSKAEVTGDDLKDASIQMDPQDNRPQVGLAFNAKGAEKFEKVTGEAIHKRMAIVLDGIVHSAPTIQARIAGGHAQITLGRGDYNELLSQAKDLSIVLRAGALPARLEFLEQRVVGPSLGQDSVQNGKLASIVGCLAVFFFMILYYRVSGVIADLSLMLNVLFVVAILVGLEATLTLPGIAGIALTVGIAVDSNVVIYERIREELRLGKSPKAAVQLGFDKAFRTIMDANVTNACAAFFLMEFGTGPIRGFAVTLLIGIITTLFTAIFVSRLFMDFYLEKFKIKEMSI